MWRLTARKYRSKVLLLAFLICMVVFIHLLTASGLPVFSTGGVRRVSTADSWYSTVYNSLSTERVNIAIFEEHHEALQYWYTAVDKGIIPKFNNTLVHIDAHSDMAPPLYHKKMPWYSYPKSHDQVAAMMIQNDVFILAAAMTGLIDRIVWIYPPWLSLGSDETVFKKSTGTERHYIGIGHFKFAYEDSPLKQRTSFCACYEVMGNECLFVDTYNSVVDDYNKPCHIDKKVGIYQIHSDEANILLPKILMDEKPILDIDEDFFGTMSGVPMLSTLKWESVEAIDGILGKVFLITDSDQEREAHEFLTRFIRLVVETCQVVSSVKRKCSDGQLNSILTTLKDKGHDFASIGMTKPDLKLLKEFLSTFTRLLDIDQIKQVVRAGFCMGVSPLTARVHNNDEDDLYGQMLICHGRNSPASNNQIKVPSRKELEKTASLMNKLIELVPNTDLVTICRSNRDGYVPRLLMPSIENHILSSLQKIHTTANVIYDRQLMNHLHKRPADDIF